MKHLTFGNMSVACLALIAFVTILDREEAIDLTNPVPPVSDRTPGLKPGEAIGAQGLVAAANAAPARAAAPAETTPRQVAAVTPDPAQGRRVFNQCAACHDVAKEGSKTGPHLVGIYGRPVAAAGDFRYSDAMGSSGVVWNTQTLSAFLRNPQEKIPGNRMSFRGVRDEAQLAHLIAFLKEPQRAQ